MSHRITTQSEIKDAELAKSAISSLGYSFRESGSTLYITSGGNLKGVNINLNTGVISGDSDPGYGGHTQESMGVLRQAYGEQLARKQILLEGHDVEERTVETIDNEQCVVLYCMTG